MGFGSGLVIKIPTPHTKTISQTTLAIVIASIKCVPTLRIIHSRCLKTCDVCVRFRDGLYYRWVQAYRKDHWWVWLCLPSPPDQIPREMSRHLFPLTELKKKKKRQGKPYNGKTLNARQSMHFALQAKSLCCTTCSWTVCLVLLRTMQMLFWSSTIYTTDMMHRKKCNKQKHNHSMSMCLDVVWDKNWMMMKDCLFVYMSFCFQK